jgi:hypothetical protein
MFEENIYPTKVVIRDRQPIQDSARILPRLRNSMNDHRNRQFFMGA